VGLVENGEITYARGFGVQSLATRTPVTPDSMFCVASITKCFVATAMMQLVERGVLQLDAPLVQYLPEFRLDDERYRQITLRQMLSHTSGMSDSEEAEYEELIAHPEYDEGAPERYVHALASRKMVAAPGERFAYSNIAYNVLGYLIARISGQTFEDYMKEHVLEPAGMPESALSHLEVPPDRLAVPHLRTPAMTVNPVYPYHRADAPASFLHASVLEMCNWAITSLRGAAGDATSLLSPASYALMWTPVADWGYPPFYEHIGLGWTLGHFDGVKTVSHGGMGFGWTDFFTILPEKNSAAVILCNEESWARSRTLQAAVHVLLGRQPVVDTVSWMVPISRALAEGGIQAANERYVEIKDDPNYFFDEDELFNLVYQLQSVQKFDLAIAVLEFNLEVYPRHLDSLLMLARLCLRQGDRSRAEAALHKMLQIEPANPTALELLAELKRGS
jgi:CubicO group peptidase (beta-lactamase class C family)